MPAHLQRRTGVQLGEGSLKGRGATGAGGLDGCRLRLPDHAHLVPRLHQAPHVHVQAEGRDGSDQVVVVREGEDIEHARRRLGILAKKTKFVAALGRGSGGVVEWGVECANPLPFLFWA